MGASTVVTHMILFIAVLGIATGLLVGLKTFSDNAESSFKTQSDAFQNQIKTSIAIELVHYNNETETTKVYVKNTGETKHRLGEIDVYLNGERIPRNETNRTIGVLSDTERTEEGVWNKKEKILIEIYDALQEEETHEVIVTTPYEGRASETIST